MRRFYYHSLPEVGNNICLDTHKIAITCFELLGYPKNEKVEFFDGNGTRFVLLFYGTFKKRFWKS